MLQVTGHAGGIPIASPRGRSVEVPFGRESAIVQLKVIELSSDLKKNMVRFVALPALCF